MNLVNEIMADAPDYHLGILWDYIDDNLPDSELLVDDIEDEANALWDMYHELVRKYPTYDMTHGQTRIRPDFALRNFAASWNAVHRDFVEATTEEAINYRQWLREHEMAAAQSAVQLAAHQAALEDQGPNPIGYISDSVVSDAEQQAAQDPSARRVRRRLNNSDDPESPYLSGNGKMINRKRALNIHTPDFHEIGGTLRSGAHLMLAQAMKGGARAKRQYLGGSFRFQLVKDSATSLYNKIRREITDPHSFTRKNAAPIALSALLLSGAIAGEMPANTKQEQFYDFNKKPKELQYTNFWYRPELSEVITI